MEPSKKYNFPINVVDLHGSASRQALPLRTSRPVSPSHWEHLRVCLSLSTPILLCRYHFDSGSVKNRGSLSASHNKQFATAARRSRYRVQRVSEIALQLEVLPAHY